MAPYDAAREIGEGIFYLPIQPPSLRLKEGDYDSLQLVGLRRSFARNTLITIDAYFHKSVAVKG